MKIRLFIALIFNNEIIDKIVELRKRTYSDDNVTKWVHKDNLHLTLKYLGEVDEEVITKIEEKINSILRNHERINIGFTKIGIIRKHSSPIIVWLGIQHSKQLEKLFADINYVMSEVGFELEKRKFQPHITLLRIKGNEDIKKLELLANTEIKLTNIFSNEIAIIRSDLFQTGAVYTKIKSFILNKGGFNG